MLDRRSPNIGTEGQTFPRNRNRLVYLICQQSAIPIQRAIFLSRSQDQTIYFELICSLRLTNRKHVIDIAIKRIIVRDDKELVKMRNAADLHRQVFAAFGVHVGCWLVEKCDADIG